MKKSLFSTVIWSLLLLGGYSAKAQFGSGCPDTVMVQNAWASEGNPIEAYDANPGTRWGTGASDPQWLAFELDTIYNFDEVIIRWEAANAEDYRIEGTNDTAAGWITMASLENMPTTLGVGNGDRYDTISNLVGAYRYIRVFTTARTTPYGVSIWEMRFCAEKNRAVAGNTDPVANAMASATSGFVPLTVSFTGSGSTDADSDPLSYSWSFGDGSQSSMADPSHTYNDGGNYQVVLTVDDGNNGLDTSIINISTAVMPNNPAVNCGQPGVLSAYASSTAGANTAILAADGNGGTRWESAINDTAWIVFQLDSVYTLNTMIIEWEAANASDYLVQGTNDTSATGSWTTLANKTNMAYTLPAGRVDTVFNLTGNYQFVRVFGYGRTTPYAYSIFEATFCGTGHSAGQTVNNAPTAAFTATPTLGNEPLLVNFDASASVDPDGDTLTYSWDFGDGNFGVDTTVSHTYTLAGNYWAVLTVDDGNGGTAMDSTMITVNPANVNNAPALSFTVNPVSGRVPLTVVVDASASTDVDNDPLAYTWDFGNGLTSFDAQDTVVYGAVGTYWAVITIDDGNGGVVSDSVQITVNPNTPPTADFTAMPTGGQAPLMVSFDASASADADGDTLTYSWDFGDGMTGTDTTVTHTYTSVGIYTVVLTVDDGNGGTAMDSTQIQVYPNTPVLSCGNSIIDTAWASEEIPGYEAALTHDGDPNTRWGTSASDPQWIAYELNGTYTLNGVIINWEAANAQDYQIQATNDTALGWITLASRVNMPATLGQTPSNRVDTINGLAGDYKFVRIYGTSRTTPFGYSIYEVSICGVNANNAPVPSVMATPTSGTAPLTVTFDATGTTDAENDSLTFLWDFDNGMTALGDSLDFTFFNAGVYDVVLTVGDGNGNFAMDTTTITVNAAPVIPVTNCSVAIIDSAWATSGDASLAVDNNMGTRWESAFTDPQSITFMLDNEYILNGMVINWETASAESYLLQATNDTNLGWTTIAYQNDLPNTANRVDTLTNLSGSYQYLRIYGLSRTTVYGYSIFEVEVCGVRVNANPMISFTATPDSGYAPLQVSFDASATTDPDGDALNFAWDFGDGTTDSSGATASHTYAAGTYMAVLTVTDNFGGMVQDSVEIIATVKPNTAPVAVASADVTTGTAPLTVNFDASGSSDVDNDNLTYTWDFGDGNTATGVTTTHTYTTEGDFCTVLTVDDGNGGTAHDTICIEIDGYTSLREPAANAVVLYPNPVTDVLKVKPGNTAVKACKIIDLSGKVLLERHSEMSKEFELDVMDLPDGIYHLNLSLETGGSQSIRFIKQ